MKKGILRYFAKSAVKHLRRALFLNNFVSCRGLMCNFQIYTLAQVPSCGFCEIFKNTCSKRLEYLLMTTFVH